MKTKIKLDELGLKYEELVKSYNNGYPSFTGELAITSGFASFKEAKELAEELNGEVCCIYHRDGQQLKENRGRKYEPFSITNYIDAEGDDFNETTEENERERIVDLLKNGEPLADIGKRLQELIDCLNEQSESTESTTLVYDGYKDELVVLTDSNYELGFSEDVHNYELGVVVWEEEEGEEE